MVEDGVTTGLSNLLKNEKIECGVSWPSCFYHLPLYDLSRVRDGPVFVAAANVAISMRECMSLLDIADSTAMVLVNV